MAEPSGVPAFHAMPSLPRVLTAWLGHCPWLQRFSPPPPPEVLLALEEQRPWLQELQLLRCAIDLSVQSRRRGGLCPRALEQLLLIADALELDHGWDPLVVDGWLDRLGFWDGEV